jgi:NADH-quinone oxidoreductase subunit C
MADEPKVPPSGAPSDQSVPASLSQGGGQGAPSQPAGSPAKSGAAKAPAGPELWSGPQLEELLQRFPGAISDPQIFRGQPSIVVAKESLLALCEFLKSSEGGAYTLLTDETAVDYPKREKRFEVIYHLYSFQRNDRLRLKVLVGEDERIPSVAAIWPTAKWLEREVFDMFGVRYEGHPNLKRILLPDEWSGHPLRKDYDILRQDDAWVQANLGIKSGQ